MLDEDVDDGLGTPDKVLGIELQFLEFRILSNQIFDGIFKARNDGLEFLAPGRFLYVENDSMIYSKFPGDRQGIFGGASMVVVINGNFCHGWIGSTVLPLLPVAIEKNIELG